MKGVASYYNEFYQELARLDAAGNDYSKIAELLEQDVGGTRSLRIADLGCGYGSVSGTLVLKGHRVYGVDIGDAALRALSERGIHAIKGDLAHTMPIADGTMDIVLLLDVLEHVFNPLWLLAEVRRLLREGGALVITVPLYFDILDRARILFSGSIVSYDNLVYGRQIARQFRAYNYDHIRFFRPSDLEEMMRIAGFTIQKRIYVPIPSPGLLAPLRRPLRSLAQRFTGMFAHRMKIKAMKT